MCSSGRPVIDAERRAMVEKREQANLQLVRGWMGELCQADPSDALRHLSSINPILNRYLTLSRKLQLDRDQYQPVKQLIQLLLVLFRSDPPPKQAVLACKWLYTYVREKMATELDTDLLPLTDAVIRVGQLPFENFYVLEKCLKVMLQDMQNQRSDRVDAHTNFWVKNINSITQSQLAIVVFHCFIRMHGRSGFISTILPQLSISEEVLLLVNARTNSRLLTYYTRMKNGKVVPFGDIVRALREHNSTSIVLPWEFIDTLSRTNFQAFLKYLWKECLAEKLMGRTHQLVLMMIRRAPTGEYLLDWLENGIEELFDISIPLQRITHAGEQILHELVNDHQLFKSAWPLMVDTMRIRVKQFADFPLNKFTPQYLERLLSANCPTLPQQNRFL